MNTIEQNDNICFKAKIGMGIKNIANKQLSFNEEKVQKFAQLYEDTFSVNLDKNTIVDINDKNYYVLSHSAFPSIKYLSKEKVTVKDDILHSLLQECPKTLMRAEKFLFRKIIVSYLKKEKDFEKLDNFAQNIINENLKKSFINDIKTAERIIKENPNSKLEDWEFDAMQIKLMEEDAKTEGTDLYNLINNFTREIKYLH